MQVGEALAQLAIQAGVRYVFGVPGGQTLPFYDGIYKSNGNIKHVLMRDERSAGFAADAYARITGSLGVCDATVGPGATNLLSPLAEAYCSSIPVLAIISDIPRSWEHRRRRGNASQAMEQLAMFRPVSKWQTTLTEPSSLEALFDQAVRVAVSGRPGPVVLSIPDDIAAAETSMPQQRPDRSGRFPSHRPLADGQSIDLAVKALLKAHRPVFIVGGGAHISEAGAQVFELAQRMGVPVVTSLSGKGIISEDLPVAGGVTGSMGSPAANEIVRQADLIFFIGCKGGQLATYGYDHPAGGTAVIHLDIDPEEINRNFPNSFALVGDVQSTLNAILAFLPEAVSPNGWDLPQAVERCRRWYRESGPSDSPAKEVLAPQTVMKTINTFLTQDDLVVCDASLASGWAAVYLQLTASDSAVPGRRYLAPRGLAGLGWGAPAAIGAALAAPGRRILHFAGDGGFAYSLQEMEVMNRLGLPIISIILNNDTLGWIKHIQKKRYAERYISCDFKHIDFSTVARGFGVKGYQVTSLDQLGSILSEEKDPNGPVLLDITTDPWQTPVLRNASGPA